MSIEEAELTAAGLDPAVVARVVEQALASTPGEDPML